MKTVLITGASRRLGLFLTEYFLKQGDQVIALSRASSEALDRLAANNNLLDVISLSTYEEKNIALVIANVNERYSKIDVLIHNASVFSKNESFSGEHFQECFQLHMALPAQLNEGLKDKLYDEHAPSLIVHITDIYAENPNKEFVQYCATKAALENMSKGFAKKFAPGVRVVSIQPGPIQFLETHTEEEKEQVMKETLLPSEGGFKPIFLAIKGAIDNPYITGSSIKVDGGRALGGR